MRLGGVSRLRRGWRHAGRAPDVLSERDEQLRELGKVEHLVRILVGAAESARDRLIGEARCRDAACVGSALMRRVRIPG